MHANFFTMRAQLPPLLGQLKLQKGVQKRVISILRREIAPPIEPRRVQAQIFLKVAASHAAIGHKVGEGLVKARPFEGARLCVICFSMTKLWRSAQRAWSDQFFTRQNFQTKKERLDGKTTCSGIGRVAFAHWANRQHLPQR